MLIFFLYFTIITLSAAETAFDHIKELIDVECVHNTQQQDSVNTTELLATSDSTETLSDESENTSSDTLSDLHTKNHLPTSYATEDTNTAHSERKTITITNAIEPDMLDYEYWGKRTPESFTVLINKKEIKHGESYEVKKEEENLTITYSYSFASGIYKGSKEVTYKMNDNADKEKLTFSWNETWRVLVSNATPIKQEKVQYKKVS